MNATDALPPGARLLDARVPDDATAVLDAEACVDHAAAIDVPDRGLGGEGAVDEDRDGAGEQRGGERVADERLALVPRVTSLARDPEGISTQRRKDAGTQKYREISGLRLCALALKSLPSLAVNPAQTCDGRN